MRRSRWLAGARPLAALTALASAAVITSTAAEAQYTYNYTITPVSGDIATVYGTFSWLEPISTKTSSAITNVTFNYNIHGETYSYSNGQNTYTFEGNTYVNQATSVSFYTDGGRFLFGGSNPLLSLHGDPFQLYSVTDNTIRAEAQVTERYNLDADTGGQASGLGIFEAILSPASGGGGGGGSGGAPSPEVNAGLGFLLAGATFVFLRRKRGGRHEATAA